MSTKVKSYNKEILYNNAYPIDKHFQACVSLSRKTFEEIDEISSITRISKRSNIIELAIEYYVNLLRDEMNKKSN